LAAETLGAPFRGLSFHWVAAFRARAFEDARLIRCMWARIAAAALRLRSTSGSVPSGSTSSSKRRS
jgi:hypothetical protein